MYSIQCANTPKFNGKNKKNLKNRKSEEWNMTLA